MSTPITDLEAELKAAVASADAANTRAAKLIREMVERRGQSVRSIGRLVGQVAGMGFVHDIE